MFPNILALTISPMLEVSLTWLPFIILIAAVVSLAIAVMIRVIYLVLQLFPKSEPKK